MSNSRKTTRLATLVADSGAEHVEIEILDGRLEPVVLPYNLGRVSVRLRLGAYVVRFRLNDRVVEKLVSLERVDQEVLVRLDEPFGFVTTAPIDRAGTEAQHHREAADRLSLGDSSKPLGASAGSLLVFARGIGGGELSDFAQGVSLWTGNGDPICNLVDMGVGATREDWLGVKLEVPPGHYRLRYARSPDAYTEQSIFVCPRFGGEPPIKWQTQVFLGVGPYATDLDGPGAASLSLFIVPEASGLLREQHLKTTEAALWRLSVGRRQVAGEASHSAWRKAANPMLGLCLGLSQLSLREPAWSLVYAAFDDLFQMIGPVPDVLALGWSLLGYVDRTVETKVRRRLERAGQVTAPPVLSTSWSILQRASARCPNLLAKGSLAEDLSGRPIATGPWLVWYCSLAGSNAERQGRELGRLYTGQPAESKMRRSSVLEKRLQKHLKRVTKVGLSSITHEIARHLERDPEVPYLLQSSRFTNLERRVARYITPMADPLMHRLLDDFPVVKNRLTRTFSSADHAALESGLSLTTAATQRAIWGLWSKLIFLPLIPSREQLQGFVEAESRGSPVLKKGLGRLWKILTPLHHQGTGKVINCLQFLYLRYGGHDLFSDVAPGSKTVSLLIKQSGFVWGTRSTEVSARNLSTLLTKTRKTLRTEFESTVGRIQENLPDFALSSVLPPSSRYRTGGLLAPTAVRSPVDLAAYSSELAEFSKTLRPAIVPQVRYRIGSLDAAIDLGAREMPRVRRDQDFLEVTRQVDNLTLNAALKRGTR